MTLDTYSYTAPSRVKTLVVLIEGLSIEKFEKFYNSSLSKYFEVRLVDVTPNRGMFNPQGYPHGRVIYDYQLVLPDAESMFLQDFEPFRKVFNVLGIATHSKDLNIDEKLSQLKKQHISAINHNIIVCDTPPSIIDTLPQHKNVFYLPQSQNITALETVLCDLTSNFLESLSTYASSYQHVTLRSPGTVGGNEVSASGLGMTRSFSSSGLNGHSSPSTLSAMKNSSSSSTLITEKKKKRISSVSFLPNFENSASNLNQERVKSNRIKGRQQKIFGNFYLLSGRLSDSLKEFCDSILLLKLANDYLWLGSAMDGLGVCIMMLTFLEVPFQLPSAILSIIKGSGLISNFARDSLPLSPTNSPRNSLSRAMSNHSSSTIQQLSPTALTTEIDLSSVAEQIFELLRKAIQYYKITFDLVEDYVPQIVYCETLLRFVKLSSLIHINNGLDFRLMQHIIKGVPLPHEKEESHIGDPGASYIIDKSQIRELEAEIFTPQFTKLDFIHKARIYSCLISVATDLKLYRRRSFLLKELFDIIMPSLHDKRAEINTSLSAIAPSKKMHVDYRRNIGSITNLTDSILKSYGVAVEYPVLTDLQNVQPNWIDIHLIMLKKFIELTEKLGYFDASIKYGSILLKSYNFVLTAEEQIRILNRIKRQTKQMHLSDSKSTLYYWDDYMARDISFLPSVNDLTLLKQTKSTLVLFSKSEVYNPFSSIKDIEDELVTLVQNESTDVIVTLQNPFAFDIDVKNLEIVCQDSFNVKTVQAFPSVQQSSPQEEQTGSLIVKAGQLMDVAVTFIPMQYGKLDITGVKAEVCGCAPQEFHISVPKIFKVHQKIKQYGVSNFLESQKPSLLYQDDDTNSDTKSLKFHVLPPQPILSLIDTSLLNSSIMLLEGEMKTFTIKLQNNSEVTINNLTSVFFDSTTEPLKKALSSKLPPNEIYEIEYYLLKKLPFSIINKKDLAIIKSKEIFSIEISLLGKRGMTHGSVMLEYSNVADDSVLQYVRRIDIPINVTVYPSIEIASCDVIPIFSSNEIFTNNSELLSKDKRVGFWSYLNKRLAVGEKLTDYCFLLLDVRNSWSRDLSVKLTSSVSALLDEEMIPIMDLPDSEQCVISDTVGKSRTLRFVVPIKRIKLDEETLAKPIPSLRNKQFIFDSSTPKEEQKFVREAFWYRQELLRHIQGSWETIEDNSHGDIELRGMRLSSKMINILKVDVVEIEQSVYQDGKKLEKSDSLTYSLDLQTFYSIRTTITNRSSKPLKGMIRHVPMSKSTNVSIDRKILYNGVLQHFLPRTLESNESIDLEMSVCILESGEYEWGSLFDELESDGNGNAEEKDSHIQRGSLFIMAN